MSVLKQSYTNVVRMVSGVESAFVNAGLVCDITVQCEQTNHTVRWDGYRGHFYVYDEDAKRFVDWKDPREPLWACAVANNVAALYTSSKEKTQKDIRALKEASKTLNLFLSPDKEDEDTNSQSPQSQQAQ
jgi:hypothetical protein